MTMMLEAIPSEPVPLQPRRSKENLGSLLDLEDSMSNALFDMIGQVGRLLMLCSCRLPLRPRANPALRVGSELPMSDNIILPKYFVVFTGMGWLQGFWLHISLFCNWDN